MSINAINEMIEKMSHYDKDERYMATNDLCNQLGTDIKIDETMERRICASVLKQLDDPANDVKSIAVKCLENLIKKVQQTQVGEICDKLTSLIVDGKDELRDIYSIGLKELISHVPESMGKSVSEKLVNRLLSGITKSNDNIKRECLDNMYELLKRFGSRFIAIEDQEKVMNNVLTLLFASTSHAIICKKASICLGALAKTLTDSLLNRLVESILENIDIRSGEVGGRSPRGGISSPVGLLINSIGTIAGAVGFRLGKHLDRLIPLFIRFCGSVDDESLQTDSSIDLREHCFTGLETFVSRCPREVVGYLPQILGAATAFVTYDPNYSYDDDEEMEDEDAVGGDDDEDNHDGSDDDDSSWKVRKAAIKVLVAVISTNTHQVQPIVETYADLLISSFKERVEIVRLDVIHSLTTLLQMCDKISGGSESLIDTIKSKVPALMKAAKKQLQGQSFKTKSEIFLMLRTLITLLRGGLECYLPILVSTVGKCFQDRRDSLKLDGLVFLRVVFEFHAPDILNSLITNTLPLVIATVQDLWYKVIAEALRVLSSIITVAKPRDPISGMYIESGVDVSAIVGPIYSSILPRLEAHDIDQEIKECAINTIGVLFACLGDSIPDKIPQVLALLRERMKNDVTRVPALKALTQIASSPLALDLSSIVSSNVVELSLYLKQQSRLLKQTTLQALDALVLAKSIVFSQEDSGLIIKELASLINASDLTLAHLALVVAHNILLKYSNETIVAQLYQHVVTPVIQLASSPIQQGPTQQALIKLLQELVDLHAKNPSIGQPHSVLTKLLYDKSSERGVVKQSLFNLAKCIAGISIRSTNTIIERFTADINGSDERQKQLSLLCIGELGHQLVANTVSSIDAVKDLVVKCFDEPSEETKSAAAYALGHIAVGNMPKFLPFILEQCRSNSKSQYLLLTSLKEVVIVHASNKLSLSAYLDAILQELQYHSKAHESITSLVAECLGALTNMYPGSLVPLLMGMGADKANQRVVCVSLKFALSSDVQPESYDSLKQLVHYVFESINDADLEVRAAILIMINAAVHHNPAVVEQFVLTTISPHLVTTLRFKKERVIDLGAFKETFDDGLPLRKLSLTCIDTILDAYPDLLDIMAFVQCLPALLDDKPEIKTQTHQLVQKIIPAFSNALVSVLETAIVPLKKSIESLGKLKEDVVGPERERVQELVRSALRVVVRINSIDGIHGNRNWLEFFEKSVNSVATIADIYNSLKATEDD